MIQHRGASNHFSNDVDWSEPRRVALSLQTLAFNRDLANSRIPLLNSVYDGKHCSHTLSDSKSTELLQKLLSGLGVSATQCCG